MEIDIEEFEEVKKIELKEGFKPNIILDRLIDLKGNNLLNTELDFGVAALQSMIKFPDEILSDFNKNIIVDEALNNILKGTDKPFIDLLNEGLNKIKQQPNTEYRMLTSLSINPENFNRTISIDSCRIRFVKNYGKTYSSREGLITEKPTNYCKVIISTQKTVAEEAAENCLNALDIIRAFICLLSNYRYSKTFGMDRDPINVVCLGECLHNTNGSLVYDNFWYRPNFIKKKIYKIKDFESLNWYIKKYKGIKNKTFKKVIKNALLQYVSSFDKNDWNSAFTGAWKVLEILIGEKKAIYDNIIKRGSFLFEEHKYYKQILEHLRDYRNSYTHQGTSVSNAKTHCYQIQDIIKMLFNFVFHHANSFESHGEMKQFLLFPKGSVQMKRRIKLLNKALKYISN
ncbi:MAG: hypothetical protein GY714_03560 [Desulfobacterales bacterium]|nr:hypothetical protein [Desulfobacterales bacterium]